MQGWIKLHRKMTEWEWYQHPDVMLVFIHLLLMANHQEKTWQGVTIKPGQLVTGRKQLSKQIGLSEQKIRTCLNKLKSTSNLTIKSTNRFSVITICNWGTYQLDVNDTNQQINQQPSRPATNNQPATNQQLTTNKNDKNDKNGKKLKKSNKKKKKFEPPTLEEVRQYIKENPELSNVDPDGFFKYFTDGEWHDSKGNPVKSWKQKLRTWSSYGGINRKTSSRNKQTGSAETSLFENTKVGRDFSTESDIGITIKSID